MISCCDKADPWAREEGVGLDAKTNNLVQKILNSKDSKTTGIQEHRKPFGLVCYYVVCQYVTQVLLLLYFYCGVPSGVCGVTHFTAN